MYITFFIINICELVCILVRISIFFLGCAYLFYYTKLLFKYFFIYTCDVVIILPSWSVSMKRSLSVSARRFPLIMNAFGIVIFGTKSQQSLEKYLIQSSNSFFLTHPEVNLDYSMNSLNYLTYIVL